jgi:undecaprenyl-diphosphatase
MTTFQAIVFAVIQGISEFLPIGSKAHPILFPYLLGWQQPYGALAGALSLGSFLAVFIYFRHDWASMISSVLQVLIFRKRPMTLDERLPLFILITCFPIAIGSYYFKPSIAELDWSPVMIAGVLACVGIPLWFFDYWSRKTKNIYDLSGLQALIIGVFQAFSLLPGVDLLSCALIGAFLCNYRREAAAKYAYFGAAPILLSHSITELRGLSFSLPTAGPDISWLSFCTAVVVTLLVGLLTLGGFMKHVQTRGMAQYLWYRLILAGAVFVVYWFRGVS